MIMNVSVSDSSLEKKLRTTYDLGNLNCLEIIIINELTPQRIRLF